MATDQVPTRLNYEHLLVRRAESPLLILRRFPPESPSERERWNISGKKNMPLEKKNVVRIVESVTLMVLHEIPWRCCLPYKDPEKQRAVVRESTRQYRLRKKEASSKTLSTTIHGFPWTDETRCIVALVKRIKRLNDYNAGMLMLTTKELEDVGGLMMQRTLDGMMLVVG